MARTECCCDKVKVRVRALKIWMMFKEHGVARFGRLIDQGIAQAQYLTGLTAREPALEVMAPTVTDVVCFRVNPGGMEDGALRDRNIEIMLQLQEAGVWYGFGMGLGWLWMLAILVLVGLAIAALVKYLRT